MTAEELYRKYSRNVLLYARRLCPEAYEDVAQTVWLEALAWKVNERSLWALVRHAVYHHREQEESQERKRSALLRGEQIRSGTSYCTYCGRPTRKLLGICDAHWHRLKHGKDMTAPIRTYKRRAA